MPAPNETSARNILLGILNDMLWQVNHTNIMESHKITPMAWFLKQNPQAYHEAIAHLQALVDQLETEANRQEPKS